MPTKEISASNLVWQQLLNRQVINSTQANQIWQEQAGRSDQAIQTLLKQKPNLEKKVVELFAAYLRLPLVSLVGKKIPTQALETVSLETASQYQIVPYQFSQKILSLAVGNPWRLRQSANGIIANLKKQKKVSIRLALATFADINWGLGQYHQLSEKPKQATLDVVVKAALGQNSFQREPAVIPSVTLSGRRISSSVLNKFPPDVASKYRMIVFEVEAFPQDDRGQDKIKVALQNPQDPKVLEILRFIRGRNQIDMEIYQTSPQDIDYALNLYRNPVGKPLRTSTPPAQPIAVKKPTIPPPPPKKEESKPSPGQREELPTSPVNIPLSQVSWRLEGKVPQTTFEQISAEEKKLDEFLGKQITTLEEVKEVVKSGFVPKIVAAILAFAVSKGASDVHLEPLENDFRLRIRIDGVLQDLVRMPLQLHAPVVSRVKILSHLKIDEQRVPQDGRFDVKTGEHDIDLRVATFPTVFGEKVVMRILDKSTGLLTLDQLGLMGKSYDMVIKNIKRPYGIIISTGPTGSGKSTSLYAIISKISTPQINIVTLEDPVEYEIGGINQAQIKPRIGFGFGSGLRSILRQDPNVIMVGEIRDRETADMATHAALTGHLVLTTLHTNDAASALPRLINMGVEPFLITSSINCIMAQRLVRKLCSHCKTSVTLPPAVLVRVKKELEKIKNTQPLKFYAPQTAGCSQCNHGFKGRIGLFEVFEMSEKIENLAVDKKPANQIKEQAISEGMVTMVQDGILKALKGLTSIDEIFRVTSEI